MELKKIRLKNYKCFKSEKEFDFSKLTILTGANSSGKTSIISSLISVLQSPEFPFNYTLNGDYINLGDFIEVSNNKSPDNIIKLGFTLCEHDDDQLTNFDTYWQINKQSKQPKLYSFNYVTKNVGIEVSFLKRGNRYRIKINQLERKSDNDAFNKMMSYLNEIYIENVTKKARSRKDNLNYRIVSSNPNELIADFRNYEDLMKLMRAEENVFHFAITLQHLNSLIESLNRETNYISSFRNFPQRTFLETKIRSNKISKFGDGYLDQVLVWQTAKSPKYNELIRHLNKMKLLKNIRTFRIRGGRYDVRVRTQQKGKFSTLSDVGFGISQFLPIVVADLQLSNNSTLLVLQPEIHLHPQMQSNFGDYIVGQIKQKKKKYVIETHSEYLLNKIRLHIVKGSLKKEDVNVYYLENNGVDCEMHRIIFTEDGQIKDAPKSFFDTYMMDLKEIALSSLK
jgi:predicted ATPase